MDTMADEKEFMGVEGSGADHSVSFPGSPSAPLLKDPGSGFQLDMIYNKRGNRLTFAPPQGLVTPNDMVIDVQDAISGQLRTSVSGLGVPLVCSPDGSMRGVNACQ